MRTLVLTASMLTLAAIGVAHGTFAQDLGSAPRGFQECHREEVRGCEANYRSDAVAVYTPELHRLAERINREVNDSIRYAEDITPTGHVRDRWSMPEDSGDCEDYALMKKARLEHAGVPRGALRISIGHLPRNQDHAVLLLVTDQGTFVLDSPSRPGQRMSGELIRLGPDNGHYRSRMWQDETGRWEHNPDLRVTVRPRQR